jgi:recombination protein RecA
MTERVKVKLPDDDAVIPIPTGSTLLNLALGCGGWAKDRVFNIVGDKSTGKTLVAIDTFANFNAVIPNPKMRYAEAEAAFDDSYAHTLGFPTTVQRPKERLDTVEDFYHDLKEFRDSLKPKESGLYILDSLDALSDAAEKKTDITDATYGSSKAKMMSQLFRRIIRELDKGQCTLGVISQIRDKIGVVFGEKHSRSGGHALDFYSTHIVWLHEVAKVTHEIMGIKRATAITVLAKVRKCKVGSPHREAEFDTVFGYGIDDEMSMIDWLEKAKVLNEADAKAYKFQVKKARKNKDFAYLQELLNELKMRTTSTWKEIEALLAPSIRKYGNVVPAYAAPIDKLPKDFPDNVGEMLVKGEE